ncbi:MAG: ATP-binding cassette domain-containing protein [Candidatus Methanoplasma sp.]|jgi:ABC-type lipoprotein export system ATPase subunit|nr:ATP-binding cassette domain-containing protein [Candidatus Methanoplasma sp.]
MTADELTITVLPGTTKSGAKERFDRVDIRPGDTISIVGPTGSGKTALINDIEVFAQGDTVTGRRILVNGELPPESFVRDPSQKPIAMITQHTKCLADLSVRQFLDMHVRARKNAVPQIAEEAVALANRFTGEKVAGDDRMSSLSGGQTRSLLIADSVLISGAPILLLDEIENAGIYKDEVIKYLRGVNKAVLFVTHDPYISLLSDRRIVMRGGEVTQILVPGDSEKKALGIVAEADALLSGLRERIRSGETLKEAV